jgi:hypothetical protein
MEFRPAAGVLQRADRRPEIFHLNFFLEIAFPLVSRPLPGSILAGARVLAGRLVPTEEE